MDLVLHTDASYRNDLDTGKFARMLDDPSQCYKFYWLEAIQYKMYETVFSHEQLQKAFEKCRRDNLNAMWAVENLYIPGNTEEQFTNILEHNLRPVYDAEKLQGYGLWRYSDYVVIR